MIENREQYEKQVELLNKEAVKYYAGESCIYTDEEYDHLIAELLAYEQANNIVNPNSPAQKVNEGSADDKIEHVKPMLSLRDIFNKEDVTKWLDVMGKKSLREYYTVCVEEKIDGLSMEFIYDKGQFIKAVTRGNGYKGVDVSPVISNIDTLPKTIEFTGKLVVRGEVYMTQPAFEDYTKNVQSAANPRNLAVGLVKRKTDTSGAKYLSYFAFNLQYIEAVTEKDKELLATYQLKKHAGTISFLKQQGFTCISPIVCTLPKQVLQAIDDIASRRESLPYNIDGAVIKVDELYAREKLGDDGATPKWAVAYKYPAREVFSTIMSIDFQLGKTGKITPVANIIPVNVDGSTVSRVTLHNKDRMDALHACVGDDVCVYKAGDIIPAVKYVKHKEGAEPYSFPTVCPVCGAPLEIDTCVNFDCPQKNELRVMCWAGKEGVDIKGMSSGIVHQLMKAGLVHTAADFYTLEAEQLVKLKGFGSNKVKKLLKAIDTSLNTDFSHTLSGLSIDGLGFSNANKLALKYRNWAALMSGSLDEFTDLIGQVNGERIYTMLHNNYYATLIEKLKVLFPFE